MVLTKVVLGVLAVTSNSFKLTLPIPTAKIVISGTTACNLVAAATVAA